MITTLLKESRLTLSDLSESEAVSESTTWRWCLHGIDGHKLEYFKIGGRRFTTREAFNRFVAAINGESIVVKPVDRTREVCCA